MIGDGIVKKNIDQLFKIFPDSAIHVRDSWRMNSHQDGEIGMNVKNTFILKSVQNGIAVITSEGKMVSDKAGTAIPGYTNAAISDLKGVQQGQFEVETGTGMLNSCKITAQIEGTIRVMGREVPVTIKNAVKIERRK